MGQLLETATRLGWDDALLAELSEAMFDKSFSNLTDGEEARMAQALDRYETMANRSVRPCDFTGERTEENAMTCYCGEPAWDICYCTPLCDKHVLIMDAKYGRYVSGVLEEYGQ